MDNYTDILNDIADKECESALAVGIVTALAVVVLWTAILINFKKEKIQHPRLYASDIEKKDRVKAVLTSVVISTICIVLCALISRDTVNMISDINKDISENSYVTYTGRYCISTVVRSKGQLYDKWKTVDLDNGKFVLLYMDNFKEYLQLDEGCYNGKIVYGVNSLIVVEIDNQ